MTGPDPFLDFFGLGYGFYNGFRISRVDPGTKFTCPLTGEVVTVEDGIGIMEGRHAYLTPTDYDLLKAKIAGDHADQAQAHYDALRGHA